MSTRSEMRSGLRPLPDWWPEEVLGMGARRVEAFARCAACPGDVHIQTCGTWVRYGRVALCLRCARVIAAGADVEFVRQAIGRIRRLVDVPSAIGPADSQEMR